MSNDVWCLNTETQSHRDDAETQSRRGCAEKMYFSVGSVSELCGDASSSPAAKRPASRESAGANTRPTYSDVVLYSAPALSRETPSARARRVARASVLRFAFVLLILLSSAVASAQTAKPAQAPKPAGPLRIGVTLHPYYSWTANVVGNLPGYEVRALLPGDIDAGDYQPRPQDIKRLADLDVVIVNGIGHDDFIFPMLKASGNTRATVVRVNAETPMIRAGRGSGVNSHTFISFSNAIQQTYCHPAGAGRPAPAGCGIASAECGGIRAPPAPDQSEGGSAACRCENHARRDGARRIRISPAGIRARGWRRRAAVARADAVGWRAARHGGSPQARENRRRLQRGDVSRAAAEGVARRGRP